jgi:YrbI family 3-deoxy-D-manno-octulosonate 8-phosphate phosphatase
MQTFNIKLKQIDLIAMDFDGVLTDNKVLTFQDGSEAVYANRSDGLAVSKLKEMNIPMVVISTEKNKVVASRSAKLNLECIQGVDNKKESLTAYCNKNKFDPDKVLFIGNDINDKEVMKFVGYPLCPSDAHRSIKNISKYIFDKKGGEGVVRELLDLIKKTEGE